MEVYMRLEGLSRTENILLEQILSKCEARTLANLGKPKGLQDVSERVKTYIDRIIETLDDRYDELLLTFVESELLSSRHDDRYW